MIKNEVVCKNIKKSTIIYRASLRGLKKCSSCGRLNGQRALICCNINCDLRNKRLVFIKPFDPIQLVTYSHTKLYSLRSKEKLLQPRIFVSITETPGTSQSRPSVVCYVDNCKSDGFEPIHSICRHIKACKVLTNVARAEAYPIEKSILWNLNIHIAQKQRLWDLYQLEEKLIHPVQRLNSTVFAVKCLKSKLFPAGRLHVTVFSNKVPKKSGKFSCSCKKLKIMLESDSVVMKPEICDHLLLLLSAILTKPDSKTLYGKFVNALQHLWMPTFLDTPILECNARPQFITYDLPLEKSNKANSKGENSEMCQNSEDIFNFTSELFVENGIPDFSDIILDVNNDTVSNIANISKQKQTSIEMHFKDPKLNASVTSINDEEIALNFTHIDAPELLTKSFCELNTEAPILFSENGLSAIEQFQINQSIQVPDDNIELAKDIESLNCLESQILETSTISPTYFANQKSLLKTSAINENCVQELVTNATTAFPVQKSVVFKKAPVKIKIDQQVTKLPTEKIMQNKNIDANKAIALKNNLNNKFVKEMVNNSNIDGCNTISAISLQPNSQYENERKFFRIPSLSYESWLDYVIENLNEKITVPNSAIKSVFHVPETMFNHFSKSFTLNKQRRLPNNTTIIKNKHKGHIKYTWLFHNATAVQRVFKTKNLTISLERSYQRLADGSYELHSLDIPANTTVNKNLRKIYPKIRLYKAFIQFNNNVECFNNLEPNHKCGLRLEWVPSAFPKSNFGLMSIELCVGVKQHDWTL